MLDPMPGPKRKTRKHDDRYEACRLAWERGRENPDRGAANWMLDPADLPVDPAAFVSKFEPNPLAAIAQAEQRQAASAERWPTSVR
jgi:hypothetical protein